MIDEVAVFDVSDILERAVSTAAEVALVGLPALFAALKGPNSRAALLAFGVAAGAAAVSVLKNAAREFLNARKARVQF